MHFNKRGIVLIMLILLLAGGILTENDRGDTMTKTGHPVMTDRDLPHIDKDVPAVTETATFALG